MSCIWVQSRQSGMVLDTLFMKHLPCGTQVFPPLYLGKHSGHAAAGTHTHRMFADIKSDEGKKKTQNPDLDKFSSI